MKRIEIIFNEAIEEDLIASLQPIPEANFYTLIPGVRGKGYSTPKMGDSIWPGSNAIMLIYCQEKAANAILESVARMQKRFPDEGLAVFCI